MKKKMKYMAMAGMLVLASIAQATVIDIDGSQNEFADYSSLVQNDGFPDSSVNDGSVSLSVGRFGSDATSITLWGGNGVSAGTEIDFRAKFAGGDSATALATNGFLAIKLDSSAFDSDNFTLDAVSVSVARNGSGAAKGWQFAYDAAGDGFDAGDFLGTATNVTDTGTFTLTESLTTVGATFQEVRLYYWGASNKDGNSHLYDVTTTYAIPEPATLSLVSISGLGILFIRRKLMM